VVRSRAKIEHRLIVNAMRDPSLKHAFTADPKPFVEAELGHTLPTTLRIEVIEETAADRYLVIPCNYSDSVGKISLEEAADWVLDGRRTALLDSGQACQLLVQSWSDPAFNVELARDPAALLLDCFGVRIDPATTLHVRFETPEQIFIVVPDLFGYNELPNADLDEFVLLVNEPLIGPSSYLCTMKTTKSPYGCGPHEPL